MKVVILATSGVTVPSIEYLEQQELLAGVILIGSSSEIYSLQQFLQQKNIQFAHVERSDPEKLSVTINAFKSELILALDVSLDIEDRITAATDGRWIEVITKHVRSDRFETSLYWGIRKGLSHLDVMAVDIVQKSIIAEVTLDIADQDTLGALYSKASLVIAQLVQQLVTKTLSDACEIQHSNDAVLEYIESEVVSISEQDLLLDIRELTPQQTLNHIRAANPFFGGAHVRFGQHHIKLLEASFSEQPTYGAKPGTILTISQEKGMVVAVKKGSVRFDILANSEGIYTGYRLANLAGLQAGMTIS
ncbi:hypothetical protein ACFOEK_11390 [Litoribrevibacter euphylliae]|uniref:Formyl transferase C-terminal domain-containing protein n=1 Tax=Litoribrevibacter euphylliae TaxID=1834034 RepID=A0ABV7HGR9_9GAMM